ncbi:hypothetical protein RRG08_034198 [Elysia crispata]|uniref:Uncharacterized protein n=1 Tax=Elysia crispata TaxID=231223 RepID=A0AAE1DQU7_9GAST|nr:hypothetical protein RRG08_034198 [Elysia crispata]
MFTSNSATQYLLVTMMCRSGGLFDPEVTMAYKEALLTSFTSGMAGQSGLSPQDLVLPLPNRGLLWFLSPYSGRTQVDSFRFRWLNKENKLFRVAKTDDPACVSASAAWVVCASHRQAIGEVEDLE